MRWGRSAAGCGVLVLMLAGQGLAAADGRGRPQGEARTVIAIVDDGVNPYHDDFADARRQAQPSTYLSGYPKDASPLRLSLDQADYDQARAADDRVLAGVKLDRLYWVPGTSIIGAISLPGRPTDAVRQSNVDTGRDQPTRFLVDGAAHGTQVASVAAGRLHGSCPRCLLVVVQAPDREAGLRWAAAQPWIDIISNSWSQAFLVPVGGRHAGVTTTDSVNEASRIAAANGKVVIFSSGNGITGTGPYTAGATPDHSATLLSPEAGPPWVLSVGAASPRNGQASNWHDVPPDVVSYGLDWPAAAPLQTSGSSRFSGTSCSAPLVAGVIGASLLRVREAAGDSGTGYRRGSLVRLTAGTRPARTGLLSDGRLSRTELMAAVRAHARWTAFTADRQLQDPLTKPSTATAFLYQGWGLLDTASVEGITGNVLLRTTPARPEVNPWAETVEDLRSTVWGVDPPT